MAPPCARCCIAQRGPAHTRGSLLPGEPATRLRPDYIQTSRFPWIYHRACPCHGLSGQALNGHVIVSPHLGIATPGLSVPLPGLIPGHTNVSRGFIVRLALATAYPGKPFSIGHPRSPRQRGFNFPCPGNNRGNSSLTPRHEDHPCQDRSPCQDHPHGQGSTPAVPPSSLGRPHDSTRVSSTAPPMRRNNGCAGLPSG